jgi:predicted HTH transcriptional regulator
MLTEGQHIEFKPAFNEDVIETLVAFANAKGGKVLVGVDNQGKPIKNFTIGSESLQNWINEVKTKTQPQIILNMIIHRDYTSASNSIVKIFSDHILFFNPGTLPDSITIEQLPDDMHRYSFGG